MTISQVNKNESASTKFVNKLADRYHRTAKVAACFVSNRSIAGYSAIVYVNAIVEHSDSEHSEGLKLRRFDFEETELEGSFQGESIEASSEEGLTSEVASKVHSKVHSEAISFGSSRI